MTAHYNSNHQPLAGFVGARSQALKADLTKEDDVVNLFREAEYTHGPVQILVINHAIAVSQDVHLWDMSIDQWRGTIDANLTSSFLVAREYLRRLKVASGDKKEMAAIILIGSTAGKYGVSCTFNFEVANFLLEVRQGMQITLPRKVVSEENLPPLNKNMTKFDTAMMYGLTMSLKNEIVKIAPVARVNTIAPGWVKTVHPVSI